MRDNYTSKNNKSSTENSSFSGFFAPNYTQTPNIWYDEIIQSIPTRSALLVMSVIFRQTFGWHKEWDRISITQLIQKTGLTRQSVVSSTKYLVKRGLIFKHVEGRNGEQQTWYRLNIMSSNSLSENGRNSNNFDQSNLKTPTSLIIRPTKETVQNKYKEEDSARAQPPASPSVPPFFKDKKRKQTSASPPRQKEKHPPNSVSLELTNEERLKLRNILGSELEKYEEKRRAHLKKCPNSLHHKKRAIDTILEWYNQDTKEKALREKAIAENKSQSAIKRSEKARKLVKDILKENPHLGKAINPSKNDVDFYANISKGNRQYYANLSYDDPLFYGKVRSYLNKLKEHENLNFNMPVEEDEYNRWEGL